MVAAAGDPGERRAQLQHAKQLLAQIAACLRDAVPERYPREAAPHLQTLLERVEREIKLLPPPS